MAFSSLGLEGSANYIENDDEMAYDSHVQDQICDVDETEMRKDNSGDDEIDGLLMERNESRFTEDFDKNALESLLEILKPFKEAILQMETSILHPTLPMVALNYQKLLITLSPKLATRIRSLI